MNILNTTSAQALTAPWVATPRGADDWSDADMLRGEDFSEAWNEGRPLVQRATFRIGGGEWRTVEWPYPDSLTLTAEADLQAWEDEVLWHYVAEMDAAQAAAQGR